MLKTIHAQGDIPGVVRLSESIIVPWREGELTVGLKEDNTERHKVRLLLLDQGESLDRAQSVNDVLRCFYDVLEGTTVSQVVALLFTNLRSVSSSDSFER